MELLSPAGNLEKMRAAINFGADAVYLSGPGFGLRAASTEFSPADLTVAVAEAHAKGVKPNRRPSSPSLMFFSSSLVAGLAAT